MYRKLSLFILLVLIIAVLLVPKQNDYFHYLSRDFGQLHSGQKFDAEMLKDLGEYRYTNFLVFSRFHYTFGTVSVSYYGFLSFVVFEKSEEAEVKPPEITV